MENNIINNNNSLLLKFKEITDKIKFGIDIGGTLTKVCVVFYKDELKIKSIISSSNLFRYIFLTGDYYCCLTYFKSSSFEIDILPILKQLEIITPITHIEATGGGAYKFSEIMKKYFKIEFNKHDELISLVKGYLFINNYNSFYKIDENDREIPVPPEDLIYPHISVNIGSGTSILKVSGFDDIQRISGTILGGGTLIGLCKLIINENSYDKILYLCKQDDYRNIDLFIGNEINKDEDNNNLDENNIMALSLSKIEELKSSGKIVSNKDIAMSILIMICSSISQVASLLAEEHNIKQVYYIGNFTRRESPAIILLNRCMKYWNKEINTRFNYYEGYLGAMGTLIEKNE